MGAMLLARSATASTGRRNASSGPQPGPLILGLVPDQPAPGAVTDRIHKAIYCRRQAAELSQPGCLTGPGSPGQPTRAGKMPQALPSASGEPATPPDLFGGPPPVRSAGDMAAPRSPWRGPARRGRTRPAHSHVCRNEYFVHAHIYARTGILTCSLDFADGCRAVLSIVLVGNQIADYSRHHDGRLAAMTAFISSSSGPYAPQRSSLRGDAANSVRGYDEDSPIVTTGRADERTGGGPVKQAAQKPGSTSLTPVVSPQLTGSMPGVQVPSSISARGRYIRTV